MATSQFSLQPVLSYKERLEDTCQIEMAGIEADYVRELQVLDSLAEFERLVYEELEQYLGLGELDLSTIDVYFRDIQLVERKKNSQSLLLRSLAEQAQRKREELIEISKAKKTLEKLKDKHIQKINRALIQAENKVMDEIAASRFLRSETE